MNYEQFIKFMSEGLNHDDNLDEIVKNNDSPEVTNVDIMRRLARLEKLVYGVSKADRTSYNKDNYNQDDNSNE